MPPILPGDHLVPTVQCGWTLATVHELRPTAAPHVAQLSPAPTTRRRLATTTLDETAMRVAFAALLAPAVTPSDVHFMLQRVTLSAEITAASMESAQAVVQRLNVMGHPLVEAVLGVTIRASTPPLILLVAFATPAPPPPPSRPPMLPPAPPPTPPPTLPMTPPRVTSSYEPTDGADATSSALAVTRAQQQQQPLGGGIAAVLVVLGMVCVAACSLYNIGRYLRRRTGPLTSAREWLRICFELLENLKAHKKTVRRATVNLFGYFTKKRSDRHRVEPSTAPAMPSSPNATRGAAETGAVAAACDGESTTAESARWRPPPALPECELVQAATSAWGSHARDDAAIQEVPRVQAPADSSGALVRSAVPPPIGPPKWLYIDATQLVQGPFEQANILEWFVAGHLPADLLVRATNQPGETFLPLSKQVGLGGALEQPLVAFVAAMQGSSEEAAAEAVLAQQQVGSCAAADAAMTAKAAETAMAAATAAHVPPTARQRVDSSEDCEQHGGSSVFMRDAPTMLQPAYRTAPERQLAPIRSRLVPL